MFDVTAWLTAQGVEESRLVGFNKGGTVTVAGVRATMTKAEHSSSYVDNGQIISMGEAVGYMLRDGEWLYDLPHRRHGCHLLI